MRLVRGWVAALLLLAAAAQGQQAPSPSAVKAAFLYRFASFVTWPADVSPGDDDVVAIGVLGSDPFGAALEGIDGRTVGDRHVHIRRFDTPNGVEQCDMLFVSASEEQRLDDLLARLQGTPVLTVGDTSGFAERGVMINFYVQRGRIRFEINLAAAQRANLKVSSRLLRLARIVGPAP